MAGVGHTQEPSLSVEEAIQRALQERKFFITRRGPSTLLAWMGFQSALGRSNLAHNQLEIASEGGFDCTSLR